MKNLLIISALSFPLGIFAQGNGNANPQVQMQNVNYYNLINNDENINDKLIQTNIYVQQANPPAQEQQGSSLGNIFGSNEDVQQEKPCTDCDEVKKAIKLSYASSGGSYHRKSFSMKKWSRTFSGKMNMKMKKMFAKKYKVKTSYSLCFNWH